ncbi:MAG TPA: NADH-quinone oxidoreductase subunit L [Hypericibacter adhaerens]|uniref:NADH-quinone oxidoreductase subunit L n=1 Tax=Hypericibacter adhaerens TaxID=2602016 RepID=UPI002C42F46A|nr:NADH-quinone oxidoreductase subunit L [Hypericibacter adhaerens]HWA46002.1 NADH-quinone oxidoreductase subunit L [Hypericibacter adhaerens]
MDVAIVFLPLLAAIIAGCFGRLIGDRASQFVTTGALLISAVLAAIVFVDVALDGNARTTELFTWFKSGEFTLSWAIRIDTLTAVMLVVVTGVSSMVHVYSIGYMAEDKSIPRFMAYLSLFTFFMLALVTADNFMQLFFGWEGVGLSSYLLIGFWYDRPSANAAAIKAFLVNRVGDFGFALGIMGVFFVFRSVDFNTVFGAAPSMVGTTINFLGMKVDTLTTLCLLLFVGAMGKSAQLGLHTWLPDAMEGPTPVSALIHAATMVTAGVFMVCRLSPMFELAPTALAVVTIVGASTAIFAATVGLCQNDIKRVIAYSTCSQLGYMFFAAGVSAYGAAMFHLFTHAFFKALLFLGSGSVIHAMHHEQDMRKMGGIWKLIPITYALMWIGSLALAGIGIPGLFGFAGFYSKDMILESAWAAHSPVGQYAFWLGIAAALLTAFYSWRLLIMTFHGEPRADHHTMEHVHESPWVMLVPLFVLALGAVFGGILFFDLFVGHHMGEFWRNSLLVLDGHNTIEAAHEGPSWVGILPLVMGLIGIAIAYVFYMLVPGLPAALVRHVGALYRFLYNKWYFDELYDWLFVRPARWLGYEFWKQGDGALIDGLGPDGVSSLTRDLARRAGRLQTGYVYHYAFVMLIGVVLFITWYLFVQAR